TGRDNAEPRHQTFLKIFPDVLNVGRLLAEFVPTLVVDGLDTELPVYNDGLRVVGIWRGRLDLEIGALLPQLLPDLGDVRLAHRRADAEDFGLVLLDQIARNFVD